MTHDPRRLRLHGVIERVPRSYQYRITCLHQGKQYIVMATGGGAQAEILAFAMAAPTTRQALRGDNYFCGRSNCRRAGAGQRRHAAASMLAISEWNRLEIALGIATSGSAKFCRASTTPSPEFCIPTSIEIVRAVRSSEPIRRLSR